MRTGAFLASMFLSRLADQALLFLVPLVVYQLTGEVGWSGLAFAAETLPRYLAFPVCGALCDRIAPLKLLGASQWWRAAACIAGAAAGALGGSVGWLIALSAVCGVLTTQGVMAREVVLPQAFAQQRFERVLAHTQAADQVGAVLGPVAAAALLAVCPWPAALAALAVPFVLAQAAVVVWRRAHPVALPARGIAQHPWHALRTALSQVLFTPGLRRLVIQAAGVNLVVGVTLASSAALATGVHAQSAAWYAGLQAAGAVVTVLILLLIGQVPLRASALGLGAYAALLAGAALTALAPGAWSYAAGYLLVIGFDKMFNVYLRGTRQPLIPPADYGKTTGAMALLNNLTQPLAGLALGAFAAPWGAGAVILALGAAMALLGAASLGLVRAPRTATRVAS
jgi:MFS family permease